MKRGKRILNFALFSVLDILIMWVSYYLAMILRLGGLSEFHNGVWFERFIKASPIFVLCFFVVMVIGGTYKVLWHFMGLGELVKTTVLCFSGAGLSFLLFTVYTKSFPGSYITNMFYLPRSIFIVAPFIASIFICFSRIILRHVYIKYRKNKNVSKLKANALIIGAGYAGAMLVESIQHNDYMKDVNIIGIIDDDPSKHGVYIHGVRVLGDRSSIIPIVKEKQVDTIIFAINTCDKEEKQKILKICQSTGCALKTVLPIWQLENYKDSKNKLVRDIEITDLLGREPIQVDIDKVAGYVTNKVVLVTGGGGSIGSELCRQIAAREPEKLIIFDIYENNAYEIQNELKRKYPALNLVVLIGSVRDSKRLEQVFNKYRPDVVYHAAAHKHVPLMEDSPNEAIKNNVIGTLKTVRVSDKYGVKRFVMISTDKAVNPTNIMGASKRICEMIVQSYNARSNTEFVAVRFGNVLGSNGSVVPLFKKQIEAGGPVTVTDPDIIRYFMTIPEAVSLVLQAGANAKGGEIFVLDMGKPVKILDMAENMIRLSGYTPYVDIDIKFVGLRPGEKKFEELLMDEEGLEKTENNLIYIGKPIVFDEEPFWKEIETLESVMYDDEIDLRTMVKNIVPTYRIPNN